MKDCINRGAYCCPACRQRATERRRTRAGLSLAPMLSVSDCTVRAIEETKERVLVEKNTKRE